MEGVGLLGDLEGGLAVEEAQRRVEIHHHLVLVVQVDVQLLHLPGAVFLCGFGELLGVRRRLHRLPAVLAHQAVAGGLGVLVLVLAVLAHDVVGDDHLGLEAPDLPGDLLREPEPALVFDDEEHGEGPHAAEPEAVEGLLVPILLRHVAVHHLDPHAPFRRIGGDDAAHHDQLVVGVGGHQHDVALIGGHLPQMDVLRHVGGVVDVPLREPAAAALVALHHFQRDPIGPFGHRKVPSVPLPIADAGADGLLVLVVEGVAALVGGHDPLPVDDAHGHVRRPVDAALAAVLQVCPGLVAVVGEAGGVVAESLPVQGAAAVEHGAAGGLGRPNGRQQEHDQQYETQYPLAHGSLFLENTLSVTIA